ncbi:MAG: Membrane transport protein [Firmicutes bacterium ADurb.Bin182]|nr:MAG: Membrane transport protein [Firmicutes bacterium ADurb.Bin182]
MELFDILLRQISVFLILMAVGFAARITNLVPKDVFTALAMVIVNLLQPLFMLTMLSSPDIRIGFTELLSLLLAFLAHYLLTLTAIGLLGKARKWEPLFTDLNKSLLTSASAGFMGVPLAVSLLGVVGTFYIALFASIDILIQWTYKVNLMRRHQQQTVQSLEIPRWKRILTPQLVSVAAGILIGVLRIDFSGSILWDTLKEVGTMMKLTGMIYVGSTLVDINRESIKYIKSFIFIVVVRMVLYPIAFCYLLSLLPWFTPFMIMTIAILISLPPMVSLLVMIRNMQIEETYSAQCMLVTTAISLFTIPAVLWVVMNWIV